MLLRKIKGWIFNYDICDWEDRVCVTCISHLRRICVTIAVYLFIHHSSKKYNLASHRAWLLIIDQLGCPTEDSTLQQPGQRPRYP